MKHLLNTEYFLEISHFILTGILNVKMSQQRIGNDTTAQTDLTQLKNDLNVDFYPLFEELTGFSSDIDGIKILVLAKKKQNLFKTTGKKIVSLSKINMLKMTPKNDEIIRIVKRKKTVNNSAMFSFDPRASIKNNLEFSKFKLPALAENQLKSDLMPAKAYEHFEKIVWINFLNFQITR